MHGSHAKEAYTMDEHGMPDLRWFAWSAEAGSLSRAAKTAHVAQSTVSRSIARLERSLGVILFHRTARTFSLTDAGSALLPIALDVLRGVASFHDVARSLRGSAGGTVRLSLCTSLGRHVLMPRLLAWAGKHEGLELDVRFEEHFVDPRARAVDVVVRAGRPEHVEAMRTVLGDYGHVLVAAPRWVKRHGRLTQPAELSDRPTIAMRLERVWSTWIFASKSGPDRVVVRPRVVVSDADALKEAVLSGIGASILPDYLAAGELRSGALVELLPAFRIPRIPVVALHVSRRQMTRVAREAIDVLQAALRT
jgi:DNA-binding transcriptional LysR family regulator